MKHLRKRLTYANVMSSIAVFLVLGGGAAVAASTLGKNTVGKNQLKKNAVTAAKIKNGAVTGAKLKLNTIGQVPSATTAKTADTAKTAATATTATSAVNATNAANAVNAVNAANANSVGGQSVFKIFKLVPNGTTGATIGTFGGFTMRADCTGRDVQNFVLVAPNTDSDQKATGTGNEDTEARPEGVFNSRVQGVQTELSLNDENDRGQTSFTAATATGTVVSGNVGYDDPDSFNEGRANGSCAFYGQVLVG